MAAARQMVVCFKLRLTHEEPVMKLMQMAVVYGMTEPIGIESRTADPSMKQAAPASMHQRHSWKSAQGGSTWEQFVMSQSHASGGLTSPLAVLRSCCLPST